MSESTGQYAPPYRLIYDSLRQGLVIPFLGAGASLSRASVHADEPASPPADSIPSAAELTRYLAERAEFPSDETLDLAKVAQYYSLIGGRVPLYRALHQIFDRDYPIGPLHSFLASIERPMLIVTTNYDDLIERAFQEQGRPYDVVIHSSDPGAGDRILWLEHGKSKAQEISPNKLDIDMQAVTVIYKMHGAVDRRNPSLDQYVITEDDYIDFLARMTRNRAIPAIFAEAFQLRHFLFLGYSLRDWNLRVVLNRLQDSRRLSEITSWGIQHRPSLMERKFWQKRGVEVFNMDLSDFVRDLTTHR